MPAGTCSANPRSASTNSSETGAGEKPQLPTTSVVTPCRTFDSARRFSQSRQSECECMSMKPGATTLPDACRLLPAACWWRSHSAPRLHAFVTTAHPPPRPGPAAAGADVRPGPGPPGAVNGLAALDLEVKHGLDGRGLRAHE